MDLINRENIVMHKYGNEYMVSASDIEKIPVEPAIPFHDMYCMLINEYNSIIGTSDERYTGPLQVIDRIKGRIFEYRRKHFPDCK